MSVENLLQLLLYIVCVNEMALVYTVLVLISFQRNHLSFVRPSSYLCMFFSWSDDICPNDFFRTKIQYTVFALFELVQMSLMFLRFDLIENLLQIELNVGPKTF
jgi:hypothetical protein